VSLFFILGLSFLKQPWLFIKSKAKPQRLCTASAPVEICKPEVLLQV